MRRLYANKGPRGQRKMSGVGWFCTCGVLLVDTTCGNILASPRFKYGNLGKKELMARAEHLKQRIRQRAANDDLVVFVPLSNDRESV